MKPGQLRRKQNIRVNVGLKPKRFTSKPTPKSIDHADAMKGLRLLLAVRDGIVCRYHGPSCFEGLDPHHLEKQSQASNDDIANTVWLCKPANTMVEHVDRLGWERIGLCFTAKQRGGDTVEACWQRMHAAGLAERPEPSPRPAVRRVAPSPVTGQALALGSLCALCGGSGGILRVGRRFFCSSCADERFGGSA